MIERILLLIGSAIYIALGSLHLYYTFFTNRFSPWNAQAETEMKNTSPRLTRQTTMWRAWIGFNGSHSSGAIFFGLVNMLLVISLFEFVQQSARFQLLDLAMNFFYVFLARKYWFSIPYKGILIATFCFTVAFLLILTSDK